MSETQTNDTRRRGWLRFLKWEGMTARDKRNERRANRLIMLWTLSEVVCALLVKPDLLPDPVRWSLPVIAAIPGFFAIRAFVRFLREADEYIRKIQMEALAIGFGAAVVCGITFLNAVPASFDAPGEIYAAVVLLPMGIAYSLRVILAARENNR